MTNKRLYMDVHVIQTLPPSNINRDDTGSPKTAQYGGVRRARVSSQAWKRAMRSYFNENGQEFGVGVRTRNLVGYIAEKVMKLDPQRDPETAIKEVEEALKKATKKNSQNGISISKDHKTSALFFIGDSQAEELAKVIVNGEQTKKEDLLKILNNNPEIDIALFGRMVAEAAELNTDACSQVAHAISTHAVQTEFDYFTAMDDYAAEEQAGAGMLGTVEYNSSTLYRYANVAIHDFEKLLGDEEAAVKACELFVEAFANSLPTGKVNTFANQTVPSLVMVTLREDRPVNLVSAFEQPVQVKAGSGYVNRSIEKLSEEYEKTGKFVETPLANFYLEAAEQPMGEIGEACQNLRELLTKVGQEIQSHLKEEAGD